MKVSYLIPLFGAALSVQASTERPFGQSGPRVRSAHGLAARHNSLADTLTGAITDAISTLARVIIPNTHGSAQVPYRVLKENSDSESDGSRKAVNSQPPGVLLPTSVPFAGSDALPHSPEYKPGAPNVQESGGLGSQDKWATAIGKAKEYIAKFTDEEKVTLVTGRGWSVGLCLGNIAAVPRIGFPGLCLEDSPLGVRDADLVSVFPAGITTAATFSSELAFKRGKAMGKEHRSKGTNIQLGPGINMQRSAAAGRNWEMAGADPYLTGETAYHTIKGVQSVGVQATAKHYIGNEQEHFRQSGSSNIDPRTEREIYLHPFLRAIQADVTSVMASYNPINNSWSTQNSELLSSRLKTELGFQGFVSCPGLHSFAAGPDLACTFYQVMSDWGAQHDAVASANAGLDMTMPGDQLCCFAGQNSSFWGKNLTRAINNGSVEVDRVKDMGTRILAAWYFVGQDDPDYPKTNFNAFDNLDPKTNQHVEATADHYKIIRKIGSAGTVLLKNEKNALPFNKPKKIAIIGNDAAPPFRGPNHFGDRGGFDGTLGTGWGSGTADYSYLISPYEALQRRARKDRTGVNWTFDNFDLDTAKKVATGADAAIVFISSDSGEEYITVDNNEGDRNNLTAWQNGDALVKAVSSVNSNTIVVIHSPGQLDVEAWVDKKNVTALLWAGMPGCESGNAIRDVLWGDYNPSGRLPFTMAKKRSDYSADVTYTDIGNTGNPYVQINYTEALNVDYRHFDAKNIAPRYEFGFGKSYTTFSYHDLKTKWLSASRWNDKWGKKNAPQGLPSWLFEDVLEVSFSVKNSGAVDGHEVPQVYLGFPKSAGEPPKVLRKFDRFAIKAGQSEQITFKLNRYDLSTWDSVTSRWLRPEGTTSVYLGASSRDIRHTVKLGESK